VCVCVFCYHKCGCLSLSLCLCVGGFKQLSVLALCRCSLDCCNFVLHFAAAAAADVCFWVGTSAHVCCCSPCLWCVCPLALWRRCVWRPVPGGQHPGAFGGFGATTSQPATGGAAEGDGRWSVKQPNGAVKHHPALNVLQHSFSLTFMMTLTHMIKLMYMVDLTQTSHLIHSMIKPFS